MARGTTLANLRTQLKAELRDTQEVNAFTDAEYNYALARKQSDLAFAYDWSFLKHKWDQPIVAGSRYLTLTATDIRGQAAVINFERPILVERFYNARWFTLEYSIGAEQLNNRNSDLGQVLDPIQRWELVSNSITDTNINQFEVWPMPASAQTIRFTGQRVMGPLLVDADKAELDDLLLVYSVAADYLALRSQENAPLVLKKANDRLIKLRAGYPLNNHPVILGRRSTYERDHFRLTPLVLVAGP